jgi:hypothetical protein
MTRCPKCGKYSLHFDEYFGRFRCFDTHCGWMPLSSTECQLDRLKNRDRPYQIVRQQIDESGPALTCSYDKSNDVLLFELGLEEPTFDLPEPDGRTIWWIGRHSGIVAACAIVGASLLGTAGVKIDFSARKQAIERSLRKIPGATAAPRPCRVLIDYVFEASEHSESDATLADQRINTVFSSALNKFESEMVDVRRSAKGSHRKQGRSGVSVDLGYSHTPVIFFRSAEDNEDT